MMSQKGRMRATKMDPLTTFAPAVEASSAERPITIA
jgi:hypothetical protein